MTERETFRLAPPVIFWWVWVAFVALNVIDYSVQGLTSARFSVAWPRIFPNGTGQPNQKGVDFYKRYAEALHTAGIEPFCTLYHWDLPQVLEDKGGWQSKDTSKAFADYAAYVTEHVSDRVKHFFTINECSRLVHLGHGSGADAPGLTLPRSELNQVRHNVALGHGLAVQAVRAHGRAGTLVDRKSVV